MVGTIERSHSTGFKEILTRLEKRVKDQEERKDAPTRQQFVVCWNCGHTLVRAGNFAEGNRTLRMYTKIRLLLMALLHMGHTLVFAAR